MITCLTITGKKYQQFEKRAKKCRDWQTVGHHTVIYDDEHCPIKAVGAFRNSGLRSLTNDTHYIAHFDVDDISAPNRLAVQLAHIQKTGKLVTGLYDCPMYDVKHDKVWMYENPRHSPYAVGCSLFYKREAWEKHKFPDRTPEDNLWRNAVGGENIESRSVWENGKPLMIQVIHGGNASASIVRSSVYYKEPSEAQEKAVRELLQSA
jgi:hypothetical protein